MASVTVWTRARGGGTDLERGYGDVRPWRPPFHASPAARKGPISSKSASSQDPLLRKFWNFSLNSLNFHPNFSSQAPQIWKFSAHKPPNLEIFRSQAPLFRGKCQFASPTLRKSGPHTPTWKKVESPPPPGTRVHVFVFNFRHGHFRTNYVFFFLYFPVFNIPGTLKYASAPGFSSPFSPCSQVWKHRCQADIHTRIWVCYIQRSGGSRPTPGVKCTVV